MAPRVVEHLSVVAEGEALRLQRELASRVETNDRLPHPIARVAGVDVAYDEHSDRLFAAAVVLDAKTLDAMETAGVEAKARFPYVPGLFSFRELPPVAAALEKLTAPPDLVVCDGHGRAHPRRFGLACHLGVLLDIPAIGCGKTRLTGEFEAPGPERGDWSPLVEGGEEIGSVLRTQRGIRPVFVSVGHRVSLATARDWILRLTPTFRLPETTREANRLVNQMRRGGSALF